MQIAFASRGPFGARLWAFLALPILLGLLAGWPTGDLVAQNPAKKPPKEEEEEPVRPKAKVPPRMEEEERSAKTTKSAKALERPGGARSTVTGSPCRRRAGNRAEPSGTAATPP